RVGNGHLVVEQVRNDRDDGQENRAGQSNPAHGIVQIIARGLARAHTRNVAAILLQIVRDLELVELSGYPEVGEEQDHERVQGQVKERPLTQSARQLNTDVAE